MSPHQIWKSGDVWLVWRQTCQTDGVFLMRKVTELQKHGQQVTRSSTSIVMALVRPPPHELNPPSADEISTDNAEQLVLFEKPEKEQLQLPPPRREIYLISAKLALVLILAISYLTFCFIAHYRHIPIDRLSLSFLHCEQYHSS
jgi:hypothetical protein